MSLNFLLWSGPTVSPGFRTLEKVCACHVSVARNRAGSKGSRRLRTEHATGGYRLAQRESAIIRGDLDMGENLKTTFPEQGHRVTGQTSVLKRSAAETDAGQSVRSADAIASGGDHARHRHVESRGDFA